MAVSSDGSQIPLSEAVKAVTGELPLGTAAQQSGDMIVSLTLNPYMNKWLQSFNYRVMLTWQMFGLAGLIAILIAILTVSSQAVKAAIANPNKIAAYRING